MKKKISIIAILIALTLILFTAFSYATEIQPRTVVPTDEVMPISEGEAVTTNEEGTQEEETDLENEEYDIVYDDLYIFEDSDYEMNKIVDGNIFLMASGDVKFTGTVNGSVYILADGSVEFTNEASIADAVYILATENIKVNGKIYDIYSMSDELELMENAFISRDVRAVANNMKLRGTIYRDVYLEAESIDVKDESSELVIGRNFNYTSGQEIEGINEVVKYGEVKFSLQQEDTEEEVIESPAEKITNYVWGALSSAVYVLVVYGILKLIAPKFGEKAGKDLREKGIVAFAVGLLVWVIIALVIVATIILLFTSLGAPVAVISWILMLVGIYISPAVFSISILKAFTKEKENFGLDIAILAVVAIVVWLLQQIPYVGGWASFIIVTTGLGLVIRNVVVKKEAKVEKVTEEVVENVVITENNDNTPQE